MVGDSIWVEVGVEVKAVIKVGDESAAGINAENGVEIGFGFRVTVSMRFSLAWRSE